MATVLVTGGAGFIGSHAVDALLARGDDVLALDDCSSGTTENLARASEHPRFEFHPGSVLDRGLVERLVARADAVLHLAAVVGVAPVIEDPLRVLATNIAGTEAVLDAVTRHRRRVLVASTSEIYGRNPEVPLSETADRVLGPPSVARWAYSTSKAASEIAAFARHRRHGLSGVVARLFNTVGPRQRGGYGGVLPRFVTQALRGEALTVHGTGEQSRCFCHVADAVDALLGLLDHPGAAGVAFNVGSTEEVTINELADRVKLRTGSTSPIVHVPYGEAYGPGFEDVQRRVPETGRIRQLLGWRPARDLDGAIDDVLARLRTDGRA